MISAIIPTYKSPEVLDIALSSAINNQDNTNEIIVVADGFYDINRSVLEKWKQDITIIDVVENAGLCAAYNMGVFNSSCEKILLVNDDNVFPRNWDTKLEKVYLPNALISPNQIEPTNSIFPQFVIKNLGKQDSFDMTNFLEYADSISEDRTDNCGYTLPIFMSRTDYVRLGGWDEKYPKIGLVADWDFFLRCKLAGLKIIRSYSCHFYHFGSVTSNNKELYDRQRNELISHLYAEKKWGKRIQHSFLDNSKYI
jgi:GT2 family glycosyltransferase